MLSHCDGRSIPQEDPRIISIRSKWEAIIYQGLPNQTPTKDGDTMKTRL